MPLSTQHRADAAKLLSNIGLVAIQDEDLEEEVFDVLLDKLYEEPFLVRTKTFGSISIHCCMWLSRLFLEHDLKATSQASRFSMPKGGH